MLNTKTMEAVAPYIEHHGNRKLTPIPGSILSTLTQGMIEKYQVMSSVRHDANSIEELSVDDVIKTISAGCEDKSLTESGSQQTLNEAVRGITQVMRNNIRLTRGTVLPLIERYTDQLTNSVSEKCNRGVLALNIVEDKRFAILGSPQLKSIVSDQIQRKQYSEVVLPRYHKQDVAAPELVNIMKTQNRAFDDIIEAWIKVNSLEVKIKEVYKDLFVGVSGNARQSHDIFIHYVNAPNYETAIIALLLCWGLVRNLQDGISLSDRDYKASMEIFSAACCGIISQAISRYERNVKNKNLVLEYPSSDRQFCYDEPENNCIVVNSETYARFLETGGRPEMIFGSYLTDRHMRMGDILENAKENMKAYSRQVERGRLISINNTLTIVQAELRDIAFDIVKSIDNQNKDETSVFETDYVVRFTGNEHMRKANDFIRSLSARHLEDYYATVRNFVCRCFFEGSMVLDLLDRIDALDPNGEKDINELALISTVDLVVDWLINQIELDTTNVSLEGYYTK